jgi:hypothetical protein
MRTPDIARRTSEIPADQDSPVLTQHTEPAPVSGRRVRSRWLVHLWLIITFAAAPLSWLFTHHDLTIHVALALAFFGLVGVHLAQRRRTAGRLAAQFAHVRSWFKPRGRLAFSDLILLLLTLNVMVSGTVDWLVGYNTAFPLRALTGLPVSYIGWHTLSTLVLIVYLVVHIIRRRQHFRISHIR